MEFIQHRNKKPPRLFFKIFPSILLVTIFTLIIAAAFFFNIIRDEIFEQTQKRLESIAHITSNRLQDVYDLNNRQAVQSFCNFISNSTGHRITIIALDGRVIADTDEDPAVMDNHAKRPEVVTCLAEGKGVSTRFSKTLKRNMMYVALLLKEGDRLAITRCAVGMTSIYDILSSARKRIAVIVISLSLFSTIAGYNIARKLSKPIEKLRLDAQIIASGKLDHRLVSYETIETQTLADSLNKMALSMKERIMEATHKYNELNAVLSSMNDGVIAVNKDETVQILNAAAVSLLNISTIQVKNKKIYEITRNTRLLRFVEESMSHNAPLEVDIEDTRSDKIINVKSSPLIDGHDELLGAIFVLSNVSQKRTIDTLRKDFAASVSHEIKTPLTAIKGFVETLEDGALQDSEIALRFLGKINRHVNRIESLVSNLMRLSKIENDMEFNEIPFESCALAPIITESVSILDDRIKIKSLNLDIAVGEDIMIQANATLLQQAVLNVLENALTYSSSSQTISVRAYEEENQIVVSVADQGIGVAPKYLDRIFERFFRVDQSRSRETGGAGLGLALVKHIMLAHNGKTHVSSTPGKGSTFSLIFPKYRVQHS